MARNARDAQATEHLETAQVTRQNRAKEESMTKRFEANWDRFTELALVEAGTRV